MYLHGATVSWIGLYFSLFPLSKSDNLCLVFETKCASSHLRGPFSLRTLIYTVPEMDKLSSVHTPFYTEPDVRCILIQEAFM